MAINVPLVPIPGAHVLKSYADGNSNGPNSSKNIYRTRAIISRGLYIFYPISKDHLFVFKEVFSENSVLMYGLYSRAASNHDAYDGARTVFKLSEEKERNFCLK